LSTSSLMGSKSSTPLRLSFPEFVDTNAFGTLAIFPTEILVKILFLLNVSDLCRLSQINRHWYKYTEGKSWIWKQFYQDFCLYFNPQTFKSGQTNQDFNWKQLFKEQVEYGNAFETKIPNVLSISPNGLQITSIHSKTNDLYHTAVSKRGYWRGIHILRVSIDQFGWGSTVGVCTGTSMAENPYPAPCLQIYSDGSISLLNEELETIDVERKEDCQIISGNTIAIHLDIERKTVEFWVNNEMWVRVLNVAHQNLLPFHFMLQIKHNNTAHKFTII